MTSSGSAQVGRRVRNRRDKQVRIFSSAASLFAERGFDGVTAQEISDRADIAAGTLFRYAASKGELLLMVYNEDFRVALERGERVALARRDSGEAILAIVAALMESAAHSHGNSVAYQRELVFGMPGRYRAQGLALVARMEQVVAERLVADARRRHPSARRIRQHAGVAARGVFAVTHLVLAHPAVRPRHDTLGELREQIGQIVGGFHAAIDAEVDDKAGPHGSRPERRAP